MEHSSKRSGDAEIIRMAKIGVQGEGKWIPGKTDEGVVSS
jgi:hypothetical protein